MDFAWISPGAKFGEFLGASVFTRGNFAWGGI
ncbi:hypothetical protein A2U01_0077827, partial [Trifolium medium]|nr:hypothetical protein [Trifolium medium]